MKEGVNGAVNGAKNVVADGLATAAPVVPAQPGRIVAGVSHLAKSTPKAATKAPVAAKTGQ